MNELKVKRRYIKVIGFAVLMAILLLTVPNKTGAAEQQETAVQTSVTAKPESPQNRSFDVTVKLWSDAPVSKQKNATVLVLDVSQDMTQLAQTPDGKVYTPNVLYESIDEKAELYTKVEGIYRKIFRKNDDWYLAVWDQDGNQAAQTDSIGTHGAAGVRFTQPVYEKGTAKTKLEFQTEAARRYVQEMAAASEENKIALVYYSGEVTVQAPVSLTAENVTMLLESLSECGSLIKGESASLSALEKTAEIVREVQSSGYESSCVVMVSGCACTEQSNVEERQKKAAKATAQMRQNGTRIYIASLLGEDDEAEALLSAIATNPLEQCYQAAAPETLSDILHGFLSDALDAQTVTAVFALDPRFAMTQQQQTSVLKSGGQIRAQEDGTLEISWEVPLPYPTNSPWTASFAVSAKPEFIGGNDIPFVSEKTGVYLSAQKLADLKCPAFNVPVKLELEKQEVTLFLGQPVPAKINGQPLEESMRKQASPNWYGKGETGTLTVLWKTENGAKIGGTRELQAVKPGKSGSYEILLTYTPKTDGAVSIGTPNGVCMKTAQLHVTVVSGTVRVKLNLSAEEAADTGASYVFKLSNGTDIRYAAIDLGSRNEDGEGVVLEAVFRDLPFGCYTLTQEYDFTNETGMAPATDEGIACRIGFAQDSDKIDLQNTQQVLYADPSVRSGEHQTGSRSAQVKADGFQIQS